MLPHLALPRIPPLSYNNKKSMFKFDYVDVQVLNAVPVFSARSLVTGGVGSAHVSDLFGRASFVVRLQVVYPRFVYLRTPSSSFLILHSAQWYLNENVLDTVLS